MSKAVFFDRDGTLIKDKNYLDTPEGVEWYSGAFEALRSLSEAGFELVLITNQSGVARGYMTEEDVEAIHDRIEEDLRDEGLSLAEIYYCPFLEDGDVEEYSKDSPLRKPSPGMLHQARDNLGINLEASYLVGDKLSDVEAGLRAGATPVLVRTGKGEEAETELSEREVKPGVIVDSIADVADWILDHANERDTSRG